jgi:transforming growth factor-beta-induced protein
VIVADLLAENGVVHVIDAVLVPELEEPLPATVVDIIVNSADHTTLETAVIAAGLADDLSGTGPFTVFAPTDAAFAALPAGVLDDLLADPTGALANVLLYHVVAGQTLSTDLSNGQIIETLLTDEEVVITINANGVFVNDAEIVVVDLLAENGVVHVIDMVLSPTISVSEASTISANVYPNPAEDQLSIVLESSLTNAMYQIYDMRGSIVKQGMLNSMTNNLDIQDMASGPYQLRIVSNERSAVLPFIRK